MNVEGIWHVEWILNQFPHHVLDNGTTVTVKLLTKEIAEVSFFDAISKKDRKGSNNIVVDPSQQSLSGSFTDEHVYHLTLRVEEQTVVDSSGRISKVEAVYGSIYCREPAEDSGGQWGGHR